MWKTQAFLSVNVLILPNSWYLWSSCSSGSANLPPFVKNLLIAGAAGLTAAFIDESIQLFVEGRAGTVPDMWVDLASVVTGCLVVKGIGLVCDYIKIKREA